MYVWFLFVVELNGLPAAVDFSYICIYGFSFSAIAAVHVTFSIQPSFIYYLNRSAVSQIGRMCLCFSPSVCVRALIWVLGAATYVPQSHCMLPNNWHDFFLYSKANIDFKPIAIDLLNSKKIRILLECVPLPKLTYELEKNIKLNIVAFLCEKWHALRLFITIYLKTIDSPIGADTMNNRLIVSIYEKKHHQN